MAKFEISLLLTKTKDNGEFYTDKLNFICFCKDTYDEEEIDEKTDQLIKDHISDSEDQILFGSADIIVKDVHVSTIGFQNKDCDQGLIANAIDLILGDEERMQ